VDDNNLVSEEVNKKSPPTGNTTVQLSAPLYTDPEHHSALRHRQTDRQTDGGFRANSLAVKSDKTQ